MKWAGRGGGSAGVRVACVQVANSRESVEGTLPRDWGSPTPMDGKS